MCSTRFLSLAGILGVTGILLGAFGAHILKEYLLARGMTNVWEKAVLYHLIHAVALLALGLAAGGLEPAPGRWLSRAGVSWTVGVLLFSGSLYGLAMGGPRLLGPVTPLGGLAMIAGWIFVFIAGSKGRKSSRS